MKITSAIEYMALKKKFMPKGFEISDIDFEAIALNEDLIQKVKDFTTSTEMIFAAADYGLSCNGVRATDDEELAFALCEFWLEDELDGEELKFLAGEKVCEISGLAEYIQEASKAEKLAEEAERLARAEQEVADMEAESKPGSNIVDGDDLGDTSVSLEELYEDKAAAQVA